MSLTFIDREFEWRTVIVARFVSQHDQHDTSAVVGPVLVPIVHHLVDSGKDILNTARINRCSLNGIHDIVEFVGRLLGHERGLSTKRHNTADQGLFHPWQLSSFVECSQFAIDPLESLNECLTLRNDATRTIDHPDD